MNLGWVNIALALIPPDEKFEILSMLWRAQQEAAIVNENNVSNFTVRTVAAGSMSLLHSLAAAVLSVGGLHAPVVQARHVIFHTEPRMIGDGVIVPGFGNSFYKNQVDPAWTNLLLHIQDKYPDTAAKIQAWSNIMQASKKNHFPNAACITAAVAEIVGWPHGLEPLLVIEPRIPIWSKMFMEEQPKRRMLS